MNLQRILTYLIITFFFFYILYRLLICFNFQPELCNGETNNVWKAISVANGSKFYNDPEKLPFEVFQYTPIFEYPIVLIAKSFNKNSAEYIANVTHFGRFFILLLNLFLSFIIYQICSKTLGINSLLSVSCAFSVLLLLTHPIFAIRPDSILLVLLFGTIYYYLLQIKKIKYEFKINNYFVLSILIILCFFAKQDGIMISSVIGLDLLVNKRFKQLIFLLFSIIILFSLILTFSHFAFGNYFFKSVILGLNNPSSFSQIITIFEKAWGYYGIILSLGIIISLQLIITKNESKTIPIGIIIYFVIAVLTSAKSGSWINYYTPAVIFSTVGIFYFSNKFRSNYRNIILGSFILSVVLFNGRILFNYTLPVTKQNKKQYYTACQNVRILKSKLNITPTTNVIVLNYLERIMLFENCVLINSEYYSISKYDYSEFKNKKIKPIKYIIYYPQDIAYINHLTSLFNINIESYKHIKIKNYEVLVNPFI
jgi:hypothetical protein